MKSETNKSEKKSGRKAASDFYAPARQTRGAAPIVSASSVTGRSLTVVVAIMCFLASLTGGAVYMVNQSAAAWFLDIASEVTVQVKPIENTNIEKRVTTVALFLAKQPGISRVKPLTPKESTLLLEPWLGKNEALSALPIPRLIALEINRGRPPDLGLLTESIKKRFLGVLLDDHRHWQQQIRTVTRSMALGGIAVLVLVGAATTAIIVSATRSAMSSNSEIIEVLHFVGATDTFIAREFEKHFLALGIRAGLFGALSATAVFLLMPIIMQLIGGNAVTSAEIRRLVGTASLDIPGYILLAIVVIVIAALCMLTSRFGVYRVLQNRQ